MKYRILIFVLKHIFILSFKHRKHDYNTCIFAAVTYHPSDPANAIATGIHAADFVQESQLLLPSSDSAISRSPGSSTNSNPDCIPVNDVRSIQHSEGNRQPQAVLPQNIGRKLLIINMQCVNYPVNHF